ETQIQKALSSLSSEEMREMVDALPTAMERVRKSIRDAQGWIENSGVLIEHAPHEHLRRVFESLPMEQMRSALESVSTTRIQTALSNLSSEQVRDMVDASARAMENLRKPIQDAQDWIEKSGF